MNHLFTIGSGGQEADTLLMEIGPDLFSYALLNSPDKSFSLISYTNYREEDAVHAVKTILDSLDGNYQYVKCCSAFARALLVPMELEVESQNLPELIYEKEDVFPLQDTIQEWQISNQYSLPSEIYRLISAKFPSATFLHAYTPWLKIYNGFVAPDQVNIHFTTGYFRVLVKKNENLQLAQTYAYRSPLDVVYYLLKIFSEFGLTQSEAFLVVSGLVEQDSALYRELHHYFAHIHFAQAPSYSIPGDAHPQYYFTSLYNLAACVS